MSSTVSNIENEAKRYCTKTSLIHHLHLSPLISFSHLNFSTFPNICAALRSTLLNLSLSFFHQSFTAARGQGDPESSDSLHLPYSLGISDRRESTRNKESVDWGWTGRITILAPGRRDETKSGRSPPSALLIYRDLLLGQTKVEIE